MRKVVSLCALVASCAVVLATCNLGGSGNTYEGTFTGDKSGAVKDWELKDDGTMTGTWITNDLDTSIDIKGTYTLKNTVFNATGSGTATSLLHGKDSYTFTSLTGTVTDAAGNGTYTIEFANWSIFSGTWTVAKK